MSMTAPSPTPDSYAPWRNPDYRYYAGSWFLITFSRQIEFLAVGVHFTAKAHDAAEASFALAIVGLVRALPVMMLFIAGGHLADRFNRRTVMLLTFSLGVVSAAGLLSVALLNASDWWIYLLLVIAAVGWGLGNPARQALLPQLVPGEIFSNSVAWNSTVFYIASVTGPVVGGAILGPLSAPRLAAAFAVILGCRLVAMAAIALIRSVPPRGEIEAVSWRSLMAGVRFVWRTKLILATITLDLFAVLLGGATYLLPVYAKDILHVGALGLGCLQGAEFVGAICMALLLAHRRPLERSGPALLWAVTGFGAAWGIFGLSQWFWLSLLAMFLVGALDNISVVVRHTLVQMLTPDEMRGRVSAVNGVFIVASNDLGGVESGLTSGLLGRMFGPALGPVISVVGGGVGTILVVLGAMRLWPQLLRIGSLASIRPESPAEPDQEL